MQTLRYLVVFLALLISCNAIANDFSFCPKGFFIDEATGIEFKSRGSWSSDVVLKVSPDASVIFSGPIFPGYKLASPGNNVIDSKAKKITMNQHNKDFNAPVIKTLQRVNGGVLVTLKVQTDTKELKSPLKYRLMFPTSFFAGKTLLVGQKKIMLPTQKTEPYILLQSNTADEFRLPVDENLELGIKLCDGVARYAVADCRHHSTPEEQYHIYVDMKSDTLQFFVALLNPGESFPSTEPVAETSESQSTTGNLLGEGSGFEVGPRNIIPFAYYSWNEAWSTPATQQPTFDFVQKHAGQASMRLQADDMNKVRGRFNMNAVIFKPVRLDPNKTYTLSAWLKSDTDGMSASLDCRENVWNGTSGKTVSVTSEWARYSYTFTPSQFKLLNYCTTWIGISPAITKGQLWVDSVQLEEGGEMKENTPPPLEFGVEIDSAYKLYTPDEQVSIKAHMRNNTEAAVKSVIHYRIRDYWDREVGAGEKQIEVAANGNESLDIKLDQLPIGYYRVQLNTTNKALKDEVIFGIYQPLKSPGLLPENWPIACDAAEGNPLVRKLGFGWTRAWNFSFERICPAKNKYNFEETDIIVERCRKANMRIMPILGVSFGEHPDYDSCEVPEWAVKERRPSTLKNTQMKAVVLPTIESWKAYVKAVVSRYKDSIKAWEVLNEPNCWITADEYVPYLQATYAAAKEADPDCIIVGGCATSDWSGEPAPWTLRVLELDKCKSMDVLSIHMYSNVMPERYLDMGTSAFLESLKAGMRKFGRELPIWHSEKSYNTTEVGYSQNKYGLPGVYLKEPNFRVPNFRLKAEYLIRQGLIDSTVAKGPFFWFGHQPNNLYISPHRTPFGLHHTEFDGSPNPELLAVNGLARLLEERHNPKELVKLSETAYCALFAGKSGVLAAVWDAGAGSTLKLNNPQDFKHYNFFGVPTANTNSAIDLRSAPVYLVSSEMDVQKVKAQILGSQLLGQKVSLSGGIELEGDKLVLAVYARNLTPREATYELKIDEIPTAWALSATTASPKCAPGKYTRTVFPITAIKADTTTQIFKVSCEEEEAEVALPPFASEIALKQIVAVSQQMSAFEVLANQIKIDGKLDEWSAEGLSGAAVSEQVKDGRDNWRNPADLSCTMRFRWDNSYLYIGAVVYDNVVERNAPAESAYSSDSLELFLGLPEANDKNIDKQRNKFGPGDVQVFLAPETQTGKYTNATAWCAQKKSNGGIKVASAITDYGYILEAAIPWELPSVAFAPAKGKIVGMTFQVPDSDLKGGPSTKTIFWNGNGANWQNPQLWGTLKLE